MRCALTVRVFAFNDSVYFYTNTLSLTFFERLVWQHVAKKWIAETEKRRAISAQVYERRLVMEIGTLTISLKPLRRWTTGSGGCGSSASRSPLSK
jgi:hypothetical protein